MKAASEVEDRTRRSIEESLAQADDLAERGRFRMALSVLNIALAAHGGDPAMHTARGRAFEQLGDPYAVPARDAFLDALAIDGGHLPALSGLADAMSALGDEPEGRRIHHQIIDATQLRVGAEPGLLPLVGWSLFRLERHAEASSTFAAALRRHAADVGSGFSLGLASLAQGEDLPAARAYEAALWELVQREPERRIGPLLIAIHHLAAARERDPRLRVSEAADDVRGHLVRFLATARMSAGAHGRRARGAVGF